MRLLVGGTMKLLAIIFCVLSTHQFSVLSFNARSGTTPATRHSHQKSLHGGSHLQPNAPQTKESHRIENGNNNNNNNNNTPKANTRRRRLLIGSMILLPISSFLSTGRASVAAAAAAVATEEDVKKKPFAPLENLLPAIRVKLSIDAAIDLTKSLVAAETPDGSSSSNSNSGGVREKTLAKLEDLLLTPRNYVQQDLELRGVPSKPADLYLKSYRSNRGDLPFQKALVQSGDVDAWKRLKRREKALERSSSIRAALNAYTDALSFSGESYLLRVDQQTRSSMVREDRLPDIKQVITSDMGMRYLYRNQILTSMDDVQAELGYQLKRSTDNNEIFDGTDLLDLLGLARDAMDRWLSLVPAGDVEEAMRTIAHVEKIKQ